MLQNILDKKIGIIGGGQLGKMMILEAKKFGFYTAVLDPVQNCPAHSIADFHIIADFDDKNAFHELSEHCDIITYEFEHIDADALMKLEQKDVTIYPSPKSLKIIQNKFTQKSKMAEAGLPVPKMINITCFEDLFKAGKKFGYPYILKTCTGGYDGKGNAVVEHINCTETAYQQLGAGTLPLLAEEIINFKMEISILACRSIDGETVVYPVGKNTHKDSILAETVVPAPISPLAYQKAVAIAEKVMKLFNGVGMFCVELFVTKEENIYINEVAPRPHNSGHYSIEACVTSQFEQHIRAVSGLPLGDTALIKPAAMRNLLGKSSGKTFVFGIEKALSIKGAKVHIYGKENTAPMRKMGHITVLADTPEEASKLCLTAKNEIEILSMQEVNKCQKSE